VISIEVPSQQCLGTEETDKNPSQDRRERHQESKRKLPAYNFTDYLFYVTVIQGQKLHIIVTGIGYIKNCTQFAVSSRQLKFAY
jgi:hypothetical protein